MTFMTYHATIPIHPHAMGHVIGKRGSVINRIRSECNVVTTNTPYNEDQETPVKMKIEVIHATQFNRRFFKSITKSQSAMNGAETMALIIVCKEERKFKKLKNKKIEWVKPFFSLLYSNYAIDKHFTKF